MQRSRLVRLGLLLLLLLGLVVGLTACGGSDSSSSDSTAASTEPETGGETETADSSLVLGISSSTLTDPFQALLQEEAVAAGEEAGADVLTPTNANEDPSKQLTDVAALLSQGANGLVIAPRDPAAIVPAIENANKEGAQVVAIDVAPEGGEVAMTVRADNVAMGQKDCEFIGKEVGGKGKVLELQGDLANSSGRDRTDGFENCMKEQFPNIEVIAQPTKWDADLAAKDTETVLASDPDIVAIYMESDSVMLSSVLSVLKRNGKTAKVGEPGHIVLAAIDGTPLAMEEIRNGNLDATVSQPLTEYAQLSVQYAGEAVDGATFSPGPTDHNSEIVAGANGNLEDLLEAPLVTKENVDEPELWGNKAEG